MMMALGNNLAPSSAGPSSSIQYSIVVWYHAPPIFAGHVMGAGGLRKDPYIIPSTYKNRVLSTLRVAVYRESVPLKCFCCNLVSWIPLATGKYFGSREHSPQRSPRSNLYIID